MAKEKPLLTFETLYKDMEKMDAVEFKEKYGVEKFDLKGLLDSLWLDKLATFEGKTAEQIRELYSDFIKSDFAKEIKNVEIFEPGHHNGKTFTEDDIDNILKSTKNMMNEQNLQIPIKLGHSDEQEVAKTIFGDEKKGMPALGWVKNLKKKGKKLVCDLVDIPDKLYEMLEEKMWNTRSVELWEGFVSSKGKNVGTVLTGLALLGAETPAVTGLATLFESEGEIKRYSAKAENLERRQEMGNENEETVVDDPKKGTEESETVVPTNEATQPDAGLEERESEEAGEEPTDTPATEDIPEEEPEKVNFELKKFTSEKEIEDTLKRLKKEADKGNKAIEDLAKYKKDVADKEKERTREKDAEFFEKMEKEGKLLPFQVDKLKPLFDHIEKDTEVKFYDRNLEVNKNIELKDLVVQFIESLPNQVEYQEFSKARGQTTETDLDSLVKEYIKKNPEVKPEDAYSIVAKQHGLEHLL